MLKKMDAEIAANIAAHGRFIIGVFDGDPTFSYSIGNALAGKPELITAGLHPEQAARLINAVSMKGGVKWEDGEAVSLGGKFPLKLQTCPEAVKDEYSIQATRYLGTADYRIMQVVFPDEQGRFPGEAGCAEAYASAQRLVKGLN